MKFIMLQRSRLRHFVVFWACSLWWGIVLLANVQGQRDDVRSVAIVGAGIGGSSASFFLRNVAGDDMEIHVFEQDDKAGGRTSHFVYDGHAFEVGASIIYTGNRYLFNLTEHVGLERVEPGKQEGINTGLWDGERFVLTATNSALRNLLKLGWRYGRSLLSLRSMVHDALAKFDEIYEAQADGKVFATPEELWGDVDLLDLTKITITDHIHERVGRAGSLIERDLAFASNRVNYNQDNGLNALAGVVSLCPMVTGDLFKVKGGNARLSEELLKMSATEVRLNTRVSRIVGSVKEGYSLYDRDQNKLGTFDAVLIATPIGLSDISLDIRNEDGRAEPPRKPLPVVKFQEVHTTFVRGKVNVAYFGVSSPKSMPSTVLLTAGAKDLFFSSLALYDWVGDPSERLGIYKIFSRQELWTGALDSLFVPGSWEILHHREWRAYPVLTPKKEFTPAMIFPGHPIWYVSSLEEGVSAMEIAVISAKNAVLGITKTLSSTRYSREVNGGTDASAKMASVGARANGVEL